MFSLVNSLRLFKKTLVFTSIISSLNIASGYRGVKIRKDDTCVIYYNSIFEITLFELIRSFPFISLMCEPLKLWYCQFARRSSLFFLNRSFAPEIKVCLRAKIDVPSSVNCKGGGVVTLSKFLCKKLLYLLMHVVPNGIYTIDTCTCIYVCISNLIDTVV